MGIVYHIFNPVNGECYVGQTWGTLEARWRGHCRRSNCLKLGNAIRKYGAGRFIKTILTESLQSQADMDSAEDYWIKYFDSIKSGYNLREGGNGGRLAEETKAKLSLAHIGKKASEETKAKMRAARSNVSEETKAKMRESGRAAWKARSPEPKPHRPAAIRINLSPATVGPSPSPSIRVNLIGTKMTVNGFAGRKHTEETKAKMSAGKLGNKNWLGRKHTEETKAKMRLAKLRASALKSGEQNGD